MPSHLGEQHRKPMLSKRLRFSQLAQSIRKPCLPMGSVYQRGFVLSA
jgi:hypothetical protein